MFLSIIIPCYNVEKYLPCLMKGILEVCEEHSCEILLVDDGSKDSTPNIIREFVLKYPNKVKSFFLPHNQGQSTARNYGIDRAVGEYIWFVDSDDLLNVNIVMKIIDVLEEYMPDVVFMDMQVFKDESSCDKKNILQKNSGKRVVHSFEKLQFIETDKNSIMWNYFKDAVIYPFTQVVKKSCIGSIRFPEDKKLEDVMTMPKIIANCRSYYYLPKVAIYYRVHGGSTMNSPIIQTFIDYSLAMSEIVDYLQDKLDEKTFLQMFMYYSKTLRWSLNDIIRYNLLTEETWTIYNKSLDIFYEKLNMPISKYIIKSLGNDTFKNITISSLFLFSPKLYAVIKSRKIGWLFK